jgi:tetratricopeptide (TPR) repeat protein
MLLVAGIAGSSPLWLPLLVRVSSSVSATLGLSLAGPLVLGGVAAGASAVLIGRIAPRPLPAPGWCALAVAIGLLPTTNGILPALGLVRLGLLGALLQVPLALWPARAGSRHDDNADRSSSGEGPGFAVGLTLTGGAGLLLVAAGPMFGPSLSWLSEALAGLAGGLALAAGLRGRAPRVGFVLVALAPLAMIGAGEALLRGPHLVGTLLAWGVPPLVGGSPLAPGLITAIAFGAVGVTLGTAGRRAPEGAAVGLLAWLVLPPLVGPAIAVRLLAAGLAALAVPKVLAGRHPWERGVAAMGAAGALACLALPLPPGGAAAAAPYSSFADAVDLGRIQQVAGWRSPAARASARGSVYVLDDLRPPVYWTAGRSVAVDRERGASDVFFAHLPGLLRGDAPTSVLVLDPGHGGVLDSLRGSSAGVVRVWEPAPARQWLIQTRGSWNGDVAADPAVRFLSVDPTALQPGAEQFDAVLVDLPPPWAPGGVHAWSARRISAASGALAPQGVAVFRVPLDGLSGDELAAFASTVCRAFPDVTAWLDPSGSSHLLLAGRPEAGPVDAGAMYRAWSRRTSSQALRSVALFGPADVLERLVTGRDGLLHMAEGRSGRDGHGIAVVAGARVRAGRRALPLATLAASSGDPDDLFELSSVPPEARAELAARLERAAAARSDYLALLSALAAGDSISAVEVAGRIVASGLDATKDLRSLIAPWLDRCRQYRNQGLIDQARGECMIAVSFSPADPEANLLLGDVQRLLGELEAAERTYVGVRERDPTSLGAALGLAAIHEREGRLSEAASLLEEAEKLHPGNAVLLNNLASVYLRMARITPVEQEAATFAARSRTLFQAAAALEPRMAQPRAGLAEVYSATGEMEKALVEIDRAVALEPGCAWRPLRAEILYLLARPMEAEAEVDAILYDCPDQATAMGTKGLLLNQKGCYQQAKGQWERVLQLDPSNTAAKANLRLLEDSGLLERGDQDCRP